MIYWFKVQYLKLFDCIIQLICLLSFVFMQWIKYCNSAIDIYSKAQFTKKKWVFVALVIEEGKFIFTREKWKEYTILTTKQIDISIESERWYIFPFGRYSFALVRRTLAESPKYRLCGYGHSMLLDWPNIAMTAPSDKRTINHIYMSTNIYIYIH